MNEPGQGTLSLRRQLLYPLLWLWLVVAVLSAGVAYLVSGQVSKLAFDRSLVDDARALAAQVVWKDGQPSFALDPRTASYLVYDSMDRYVYTVLSQAGETLAGRPGLVKDDLLRRAGAGEVVAFEPSFDGDTFHAVVVKIQVAGSPEPVIVAVAETSAERELLVRELAAAVILPTGVLALAAMWVVAWTVSRALRPMQRVADAAARRDIDDLNDLPTVGIPSELVPLLARFNGVLSRVRSGVVEQRRFVADAAHQLRTPIAGIKILAEDLASTPPGQADAEVIRELNAAAGRAARLASQLLALARAENLSSEPMAPVDAAVVARQVCDLWERRAQEFGKSLVCDAPRTAVPLTGRATQLAEALGNLVDNAIRYGGQQVSLNVAIQGSQVRVGVSDNGRGWTEHEASNAFRAFWRGEHAGTEGSGLGLAIVQEVAQRMGGRVETVSRPTVDGLRIDLVFLLGVAPNPPTETSAPTVVHTR
jgi:two-component system sensor histidine kinase TctE